MKEARIICIGKIRADFWKEACQHYLKLLVRLRPVAVTELKDADSSLEPAARNLREGERIAASIGAGDWPIALDLTGRQMTSPEFARLLADCAERLHKRPAFIIGGPYGLSQQVLDLSRLKISLSAMTFTHELARVLLLEQIYRAECIRAGHPYHH